ncbi:MAG: redoxin domain-containing protein [Planctomycetota bacterium]
MLHLLLLSLALATDVGARVEPFTLTDAEGIAHTLTELAGDARVTVLLFTSTECPMCNAYVPALRELHRDWAPRGVHLIAINANASEPAAKMAAHAREFGLEFAVLKDPEGAAARALGAKVTPEAFVLDHELMLRYRGRIDDAYQSRLKRSQQITTQDLRVAVDHLLSGSPIEVPVTEAFGCAIEWPRRVEPAERPATSASFNHDVLPIVQEHCQPCHRPGEVAPFSLLTYQDAVKWAGEIQYAVEERVMPPWKAEDGFGDFANQRRLSDAEISTISEWVQAGMPEGDARDLPPPRQFPAGWQMGEPDLVLEMQTDFQVPASGNDVFRYFVIPSSVGEDRYVRAVEIRPGNRKVVHHAITFLDTSGKARERDAKDALPGYSSAGPGFLPAGGLGGWAPGTRVRELPDGVGYFLPAHADLVMQLHYHPSGKPEQDRTRIGLYFANGPIEKRFLVIPVAALLREIPAGDDHYVVKGSFVAPVAGKALSVFPHMHLLGKEFTMTMTGKDGTVQPLIHIKDWDWNWQEAYVYKQPIPIAPGTRIDLEAVFDNSAENRHNPNRPPQPVRWGEQTGDEMCIGFLGLTLDDPGALRKLFQGRRR